MHTQLLRQKAESPAAAAGFLDVRKVSPARHLLSGHVGLQQKQSHNNPRSLLCYLLPSYCSRHSAGAPSHPFLQRPAPNSTGDFLLSTFCLQLSTRDVHTLCCKRPASVCQQQGHLNIELDALEDDPFSWLPGSGDAALYNSSPLCMCHKIHLFQAFLTAHFSSDRSF